jgi:hypothetical protein
MAICEADEIAGINRDTKISAEPITDELVLCVLCMATNKLENPLWEDITESPLNAPLPSLQWLDALAVCHLIQCTNLGCDHWCL